MKTTLIEKNTTAQDSEFEQGPVEMLDAYSQAVIAVAEKVSPAVLNILRIN